MIGRDSGSRFLAAVAGATFARWPRAEAAARAVRARQAARLARRRRRRARRWDRSEPVAAGIAYSQFLGGSPGQGRRRRSRRGRSGSSTTRAGSRASPRARSPRRPPCKFINENLGGIDGHPVQARRVQGGRQRGAGPGVRPAVPQRQAVKVIAEDSLVVGAQTFHKTLGGKTPVVIGSPNTVADATAKNAYPISAGVFGTDPGFVYYTTQFAAGQDRVAAVPRRRPDRVRWRRTRSRRPHARPDQGHDGGYKSSAPGHPPRAWWRPAPRRLDVTIALLPSRRPASRARRRSSRRTSPSRSSRSTLHRRTGQAGDRRLPEVDVHVAEHESGGPGGDAATDGYLKVMKAYAGENANTGGFAPHAFMAVMTAAKSLVSPGGADGDRQRRSARQAEGLHRAGRRCSPPTSSAARSRRLPAIGSLQTRLYTYKGGGKWTDVTNGKWVLHGLNA